MRAYSRAPDEHSVLVIFADESAALLASSQAGMAHDFAILHFINVRRSQNTHLSRTLRAPACTPCLAPHTQSTAHAVRFWSRAVSPATHPHARALPAAVSHLLTLPRDRPAPSDRLTPRSPGPPAASRRIPALRWQARPGATLKGRSAAASASRCRSATLGRRRK